ncbi:hypothetical protein CkaCkLH20_08975 [Colletotrichum karsti]|uniref:NACHT domain-containing protein n=1 Tax=Colletotrichum karsti TaxID=1095194 RepID=A0A9P6I3W3_9PEZI|nr:uncharacterized protein CkaCkLH20_08975 [Colletotrichum karsti]KAF9873516.1 hypothetical protein CkaCkLH20_08975 [Colletotrichum karsti]
MDPVTAVAMAGNVLQFIQFVGGLLNDARKLHASATGTSGNNDHLRDICGTLMNFNTRLEKPPSESTSILVGRLSKQSEPLQECAAACKRDCSDLLAILSKLQDISTKGPRYWGSFRAALAEVWKASEIEDLRSRIADRQRQMTLLLCAASNETTLFISDCVKDLGRGIWQLHSGSRLDAVLRQIEEVKELVKNSSKSRMERPDQVSSICSGISGLSLEARAFEKEAQVLASLNYKDRPARHEKIPSAHTTTFKWSLDENREAVVDYGKLRRWLKSDQPLFWVSGKPGSGKSTLMKYIADNKESSKCLRSWAGRHDLLMISHYFTIYGTPIQRSIDGLLRSLLFGIFSRKPELIPKLMSDRWDHSTEPARWTQSELEGLIRLIGDETDEFSFKICFFIDGLDEFEGDHIDICQTLIRLSQNPCIKVCVSSRPWNVFEDALGDRAGSKLYMHELTYHDIRSYTECRLQEHPRWSVLQEETSSVSWPSLIDEVVSKSNGVFLWVTLVVRLLREGLTNDDSLSDLQRRLSSFPADLKEFFWHIIQTVDPFYNEKMAGTLSLALEAKEPLCLEIFSFHDLEYDDENYAFKEATELMSTDLGLLNKLFRTVSRRINGRCKGLLERNGDRMEFLHRTVYDFLRTGKMADFLADQTKSNCCFSLSLLKASIAWIKRSTFARGATPDGNPMIEIRGFVNRLRRTLKYARHADMHGESSAAVTAALLDNMEQSIPRMIARGQIQMTNPSLATVIFRRLVLEAGVSSYVRNKLTLDHDFFKGPSDKRVQSPLHILLDSSCEFTREDQCWIFKTLLEAGHDPNESDEESRSPLAALVSRCTSGSGETETFSRIFDYADGNILSMLLKHGADPNVMVKTWIRNERQLEVPVWLLFFLGMWRTDFIKRPEKYEQTLVVMLKAVDMVGDVMVNRLVTGKENGREIGSVAQQFNFWYMSERDLFPDRESQRNIDFLIGVFTLVLSRIPPTTPAFADAENCGGWTQACQAVRILDPSWLPVSEIGAMPQSFRACETRVPPQQAPLFTESIYWNQYPNIHHFFPNQTVHNITFSEERFLATRNNSTLCYSGGEARELETKGFKANEDLYGQGVRAGIYLNWIASLLANQLLAPRKRRTIQKAYLLTFNTILCIATYFEILRPCVFGIEIKVLYWAYWGGAVCVFNSAPNENRLGNSTRWTQLDWLSGVRYTSNALMFYHGFWFTFHGYDNSYAKMPCGTQQFIFGSLLDPSPAYCAVNYVFLVIVSVPEIRVYVSQTFTYYDNDPGGPDHSQEGFRSNPTLQTSIISKSPRLLRLLKWCKSWHGYFREVSGLPFHAQLGIRLITPLDVKNRKKYRIYCAGLWLASFILSVTGIEATLRWNKVDNIDSFNSTGQYLALPLGLFVVMDVVAKLWQQEKASCGILSLYDIVGRSS